MGHDGSSFEDEHEGSGREPVSGAAGHDRPGVGGHAARPAGDDAGLVLREPYLRRVLDGFEAGLLEPYDYTRRALAINATASTLEMEAIVQQPPEGSGNAGSAGGRGSIPSTSCSSAHGRHRGLAAPPRGMRRWRWSS